MTDNARILVTGGSGLLGRHLRPLLAGADFPATEVFDVTDFDAMLRYAERRPFEVLVHGAAFTSPPLVDKDPERAIRVNICGTANVVRLCMATGARLVYISTDYVFPGDKGMYTENDTVSPVNKYAWSKLGGECAVRLYDNSLIVRTSFGPDVFPYPKAFTDQWTSREPVSAIAAKLARLLEDCPTGVMHLGGKRQTVFEYARGRPNGGEVGGLSVKDVAFSVPRDTSLDCARYDQFINRSSKG